MSHGLAGAPLREEEEDDEDCDTGTGAGEVAALRRSLQEPDDEDAVGQAAPPTAPRGGTFGALKAGGLAARGGTFGAITPSRVSISKQGLFSRLSIRRQNKVASEFTQDPVAAAADEVAAECERQSRRISCQSNARCSTSEDGERAISLGRDAHSHPPSP